MKRIILICFLFCCAINFTFAQNVVFSLEASATTMGVQDQIQVAFTIENVQGIAGMQNPSFPGFRVAQGPMQQSGMSIINGVRSQSQSYIYILQATKTGTFTIPAISIKDENGKLYQCNSLNIKVVDGSLARQQRQQQQQDPFGGYDPFDDPFFGGNGGGGSDPFASIRQQQAQMQQMIQQMMQQQQGGTSNPQNLPNISEKDLGKNVFIRVSVDKTSAMVGEQITATYKMYTQLPMNAAISKLPSLNGFWTQDFELPKQQEPQPETLDGVRYYTFTLKKSALFPQQTGTLLLDAAEAKGVARIADRMNPYGREVQFTVKSAPVKINVTALPIKDQPENFGGAVGKFSLNSSIDKTKLTTDETAVLKLEITGSGNLKLIQAPVLKLPNGLDVFDPKIQDSITGRTTTINGFKTFEYAISPSVAGDYEIPPIPFSYYNSQSKTYTTLYTKAIKLHVTAGENYKKELKENKLLADIHDIEKQKFSAVSPSKLLFFSTGFWAMYVLPLLAFGIFLFWKRRSESEAENVGLFKNKYANKVALKRLKTAKVFLDKKQTIPFYEEITKAIWLYLSDKLNIPLANLSKETANEALAIRQVSESDLAQFNTIIDDCAMALYAPAGAAQQMNSLYTQSANLIATFEEKLKK